MTEKIYVITVTFCTADKEAAQEIIDGVRLEAQAHREHVEVEVTGDD